MERNVKISLEKARKWYNSGNKSLKEVALQAFTEDELIVNPWEKIKTFEDACMVLNINPATASLIYDTQLQNMYKLRTIKKALNGTSWEPKLNTGTIYYSWMRYYLKGSSYDSSWTPVADFKVKDDNKTYTLFVGDCYYCNGGLGYFGDGYGEINPCHMLLGCKTAKIAKYFGETFGKLIFDAIYGHYNNHEWVSN
jgi:hypothetical protein